MRIINREIVAGLVESQDNMILFGMKDPESGGVYIDCWHLPGGGVEGDETREQALAREMREELSLDLSQAEVALLDDKGTGQAEKILKETGERVLVVMKFYVYKIEYDKKAEEIEVSPGDDIAKIMWANPKKLKDYKFTPPSIELFTRLNWLQD